MKLSLEDKIDVMKIILPDFCQSLTEQPKSGQKMVKLMMNFCDQNMGGMMAGWK